MIAIYLVKEKAGEGGALSLFAEVPDTGVTMQAFDFKFCCLTAVQQSLSMEALVAMDHLPPEGGSLAQSKTGDFKSRGEAE